jgi:hypothetical protein
MMVLVKFNDVVRGEDGRSWRAQVCGRQAAENMWEGWIEFEPSAGGTAIRTPRETTQPNQTDLEYWATGLTETYLEGALERALDPDLPDLRTPETAAEAHYTAPAGAGVKNGPRSGARKATAVLNPLEVYRQGEGVLRDELGALDEDHLRSIIRAHEFADEDSVDLPAMHRPSLVELIVAAVRRRVL